MFVTPASALFVILIKLLVGFVIGLLVAALAYRSRITNGLLLRGAIFGGIAYLTASGVAGWAGLHAAFYNGQRIDVAPWGEDLWLRNRLVEYELVICIASSCIAALLAGIRFRPRTRTPAP